MGKDTSDHGLIASGMSPLMRQVGCTGVSCQFMGGCGLRGPVQQI